MKKLKRAAMFLLMGAMLLTFLAACGDKTVKDDDTVLDYDTFNFDYGMGLTEDGFLKNIRALDYVTLPSYSGITLPASLYTPDEDSLKAQIDNILTNFPEYEKITDRPVADGDTVTIDYVGYMDGEAFEGGSTGGMGTEVTIGVTSYIDDFLEQLIGHMPGETVNVEVTFPDPYQNNPAYAGKDALFVVEIGAIQGEKVDADQISDETAKNYGFDTAEELMVDLKRWLVEQQLNDYASKFLLDNAVCETIPQAAMDYIENFERAYFEQNAGYYQLSLNSYIKNMVGGYDTYEAYRQDQKDEHEEQMRYYLIIQAVAEQENIRITDEQIKASEYANYQAQYGGPFAKMFMLRDKTIPQWIIDHGVKEEG